MERYFAGCTSYDVNILIDQLRQKKQIKNWVYMNHSINTNPKDRKPLLDKFKNAPFVTYEQKVTFKEYIKSLYNHNFCFSPPGNGIDCHRTWESIYLGCIPIVRSSPLTRSFSELPIVIYEDINEITKGFLLNKLIEFHHTHFNYDKVKFSYWKNKITTLKQQL
jgi:hypothetical protein